MDVWCRLEFAPRGGKSDSKGDSATQLAGVWRLQLPARPAKRPPTAIAGRVDEQAGRSRGVAYLYFPAAAMVSFQPQPCGTEWACVRGYWAVEVPEQRLAVIRRGLEDAVQCTCRARLQVACVAWW